MGINIKHFRHLHDHVLVRRQESTYKTASGIVIPDGALEKPGQGKVVAIGAGKILKDGKVHQLDVKVGDKVLFTKHASQAGESR